MLRGPHKGGFQEDWPLKQRGQSNMTAAAGRLKTSSHKLPSETVSAGPLLSSGPVLCWPVLVIEADANVKALALCQLRIPQGHLEIPGTLLPLFRSSSRWCKLYINTFFNQGQNTDSSVLTGCKESAWSTLNKRLTSDQPPCSDAEETRIWQLGGRVLLAVREIQGRTFQWDGEEQLLILHLWILVKKGIACRK